MKGRLNQAIWTLGTINAIALFVVLYLAYSAGASANGATGMGISDAMSASGKAPMLLFMAIFISLSMTCALLFMLSNKVAKPVNELVDYSQKFAKGEYSSRPQIDSHDDVAEGVVSQIARGDLTLRGRVTNDALGNVV